MWNQYSQKLYFCTKTEKVNIVTEFHILELFIFPFFIFTTIFIIRLKTKFKLKQTILILWTKFAQKQNFDSKTKKVNMTVKFKTVKLV